MSHVLAMEFDICDLAILRRAVAALGGEWREAQRTYRWYGRLENDDPTDPGRERARAVDWGACEHAIAVPGGDYEIGVCRRADGRGFELRYDAWTYSATHGAGPLHARFGVGLKGLHREYTAQVGEAHLRRQGYRVRRRTVSGTILLEGVKA